MDEAVIAGGSFSEKDVRAALGDLAHGIDFSAFANFLHGSLSRYRAELEQDKKMMRPADALKFNNRTLDVINQVRFRMEYLPRTIERPAIEARAKRSTEPLSTLTDRIDSDLEELALLLALAAGEIEKAKGSGRKAEWHREWLLHDTANEIERLSGCGKEKAAEIAAEVIRETKWKAPEEKGKAREKVRKTAGKKKNPKL